MFRRVHIGEANGRLVVHGEGRLRDVELVEVPSQLVLTKNQKRAAELAVEELSNRGLVVTNGPIYRVENFELGDRFKIAVSLSRYFDIVAIKANPQWGLRARALTVACVVRCADGLLVEKRSQKVASVPGMFHPVPAGSIEPPHSPLHTLYEEAKEEAGLEPYEISEPSCLGMVFGEVSGIYQLICSTQTELSVDELRGRERSGAWEQESLLACPADPSGFLKWVEERNSNFTRGGRTAMMVEVARRADEAWLEAHL